jgi:REP element-mobilizing transposase RayT
VLIPFHQRKLPHIIPEAVPIFFTWRLHGTLPASRPFAAPKASGVEFRAADRELAHSKLGPVWLKNPEIASMVTDEIKATASRFHRYSLMEFVVMPNHVHLLAVPLGDPREILRILKGVTARRGNRLLGRTGFPFWQDETFDHFVRHVAHLQKIRNYIVNDPVKCGLVSRPQDYQWSSAYKEKSAAQKSQPIHSAVQK